MMPNSKIVELSPQVKEALGTGQAVVALESTIITHGMPPPHNLETALAAEQVIRDAGATPATIAMLDGRARIGLSGRDLRRLAEEPAHKCSLRDLPLRVAAGDTGGTTVAATLHLAHAAGIEVFATGGIGGVHRGAPSSMDISADLQALATYPLAVVCSGPKAILDLGLTLEVLESQGVTVLGYGTDSLPAFWTRESEFPVDARVDSPAAVADVLNSRRGLGLKGGVLVAQPVAEESAMDMTVMNDHIQAALQEAEAAGVSGKALTPFLLSCVERDSGGSSLTTNQALMHANAQLAAHIALALREA